MKTCCTFFLPGLLTGILILSACGENTPSEKKPEQQEKVSPSPKKTQPARKKTFSDSEEGSLKVRFRNDELSREKIEVRDDRENLNIIKSGDPTGVHQEKISKKELALRKSFRTPQPEKSFAALLKPLNRGKTIRWSPLWQDEFTGGIRLPSVAISPDRSIIMIAETLGESRGPFGTRLIFLDTHSWSITAVHHLWKKDIRHIAISSDHIPVLTARGQKAFKSRDEIILLDPWSGREKTVIPLPDVRKTYLDAQNRLFAVFDPESPKTRNIAVFDSLIRDGNSKFKEFSGANRSPVIAFSPDGQQFVLAGDQALEIRKNSDLKILENIPLPAEFETAALLLLPDGTVIAAPESRQQRPAIAVRNGRIQEFGEKSHGMLFEMPGSPQTFFGAVMNRRGRISRIALSTLKEESGVDPEEGRPRTTGDPMAVFAFSRIKTLAVLDEKGCFYLLYKDPAEKRWRKEILFRSTVGKEKQN